MAIPSQFNEITNGVGGDALLFEDVSAGDVGYITLTNFVAVIDDISFTFTGTLDFASATVNNLDTDQISEGSSNLYYTSARASSDAPVQSVNGNTGAVTVSVPVDSVNGQTGAVTGLLEQGKHTIGLPAAAWTPADTDGAESGTNAFTNFTLSLLDFDSATEESAYAVIPMPVSSDESAGLTAQVGWTDTDGNSGDVVWGLSAAAVGDDDGLGASFGTEVTVTDTRTAQDDLMQSPETGTITPSGSWAAGDLMVVKLARKAASGSDTLGGDARMVNVRLFYIINAATDA